MKYFPLVWANLWRKKARTAFTVLSIAIAFMLFGLLQGANAWFQGFADEAQASRLYVANRIGQLELLPKAYLERVVRTAGVRRATYLGGLVGTYQERSNTLVVYAVDATEIFELYPEWQAAAEQRQALLGTRAGAIVGARLMERYGWKIGDRIPLRTSTVKRDGSTDWSFDVVGVYDISSAPAQANRVLANYDYLDEARRFDNGRVFAFVVDADSPARSSQIAAAIDAEFANSPDETLTQDEKEFVQGQLRQIGDVNSMVNGIVIAVLFTLLFLVGNTMMQAVRERIPELAVLKTIGFSNGTVTWLVLAESLLLCVLAALLGLACAAALFPVTAALGLAGATLPARVVAAGVAIAVVLALASGLPPAHRARQLSIADALAGR
jgi:putative ABC transport system permease protein